MKDSTAGVQALLHPRNVVIVGASERPNAWPGRIWANLRRLGYTGRVYPVNPRYEQVWGQRCYPAVDVLPEAPDHLVVLVSASDVPQVLRQGARAGARSATIFAAGFGEGGDPQGLARAAELQAVITETGLAVSGPNCLGNLSASGRLVTTSHQYMSELSPEELVSGPVALVGQSGGIVLSLYRALIERGIWVSYLVSSGNEVGLTLADYIRYYAQDPLVQVIGCFIEAIRSPEEFLTACYAAKDVGKPIVALKVGHSQAGKAAALAHTGSLTGSLDAFDAVVGEAGVIRLDTIDEMVEAMDLLSHGPPLRGGGVAAITLSGGLKALLLDTAERVGLSFAELAPATLEQLRAILGVGTSVGNPLDIGFTGLSDMEAHLRCVEILLGDPGVDILLLQEEFPRGEHRTPRLENLYRINDRVAAGGKPVAVFSMMSYGLSDYGRRLRRDLSHLAYLQDVYRALRAVRAAIEYRSRHRLPAGRRPVDLGGGEVRDRVMRLLASRVENSAGRRVLNEVDSKALLRGYGIRTLEETMARSAEEAVSFANQVGYPVVLKAVSSDLPHKSDRGLVLLGLEGPDAVRRGYELLHRRSEALDPPVTLDGVLVAHQVAGGLEVFLGVQRDPEVGPVVVFGAGGVWLELHRDVAFGYPPLSESRAQDLVGRTRVGWLVDGYRGQPRRDREALVRTLVHLSWLAHDLRDVVESVDVNPFVLLPEGQGGYALDALVILRASDA